MKTEFSDDLTWPALKVTAISAVQVLVFVILYEAAVEIYVANYGPMKKVFGFGMQVDVGMYLLSILAGINALTHFHVERAGAGMARTILCAAVWIAYWGNLKEFVPNRFVLISGLGILSFLVGVLLSKRQSSGEYL